MSLVKPICFQVPKDRSLFTLQTRFPFVVPEYCVNFIFCQVIEVLLLSWKMLFYILLPNHHYLQKLADTFCLLQSTCRSPFFSSYLDLPYKSLSKLFSFQSCLFWISKKGCQKGSLIKGNILLMWHILWKIIFLLNYFWVWKIDCRSFQINTSQNPKQFSFWRVEFKSFFFHWN